MTVITIIWVLLVASDIVLVLAKRRLAGKEDDSLHVNDSEAAIVNRQQAIAPVLDKIDRWVLPLTIISIVYSVLLFAYYLYFAWHHADTFQL